MPWLLDTQGRTTRLSHSPASHRLFLDFPTIVFSLPQSDSTFLMCRRAGRCCCPCKLRASRRTSRLWPKQTFHQLNFYYDLGAIFQIIFHCVYHPFFNFGSNRLSAVLGADPSLLATIHRLQRPTDLVSMVLFCICPISTNPPPGNSCRLS